MSDPAFSSVCSAFSSCVQNEHPPRHRDMADVLLKHRGMEVGMSRWGGQSFGMSRWDRARNEHVGLQSTASGGRDGRAADDECHAVGTASGRQEPSQTGTQLTGVKQPGTKRQAPSSQEPKQTGKGRDAASPDSASRPSVGATHAHAQVTPVCESRPRSIRVPQCKPSPRSPARAAHRRRCTARAGESARCSRAAR